jgi:hypothetical protein
MPDANPKKRFKYELIPLFAMFGTVFLIIIGIIFSKNFSKIISIADNVPIAMMLIIVEFFTWMSLKQAATNDEFTRAGERHKIYEDMIR